MSAGALSPAIVTDTGVTVVVRDTILAATNKCLAHFNKSGMQAKATKKCVADITATDLRISSIEGSNDFLS
jgi:hypothetical protein